VPAILANENPATEMDPLKLKIAELEQQLNGERRLRHSMLIENRRLQHRILTLEKALAGYHYPTPQSSASA
jgi:hypothetical protein